MAEQIKKGNPAVAYFRKTWAELKKVNWPTMDQGVAMTKIVLTVTAGMAIFLGVVDFFFGWMLGGVVARDPLYLILGGVVALALVGATYLIGRGEGD